MVSTQVGLILHSFFIQLFEKLFYYKITITNTLHNRKQYRHFNPIVFSVTTCNYQLIIVLLNYTERCVTTCTTWKMLTPSLLNPFKSLPVCVIAQVIR